MPDGAPAFPPPAFDPTTLVRPDAVHRDVYTDPAIFRREMDQLWSRTWIYVGHTSQIPQPGDVWTTTAGLQPVMMVRDRDGQVRVLRNRCAHKGAKLVNAPTDNVGTFFRCPYHAWTFRLDGTLRGIPMKNAYANTTFDRCDAAAGIAPLFHAEHRGFVFTRLRDDGPDFHDFFGASLSSIDYMADRSPEGELEVAGGVLRYLHDSNWKMFVENLNDTMHPMVAHESAAGTAKKMWADQPDDAPKPMAIEQLLPFASGYGFFDKMGVRVFDNGHSYTGVHYSIHSSYSALPEYEAAMVRAYGEDRAREILGTVRHNTVYYPSLTVKGAIQTIRVVRPLAVDRTLIESWTFRLKGAPKDVGDSVLERTCTYNRLINSPLSIVGHDDQFVYRQMQEGLHADGNEWVNLQRDYDKAEDGPPDLTVNGTSEISMRNQFRAWARWMA